MAVHTGLLRMRTEGEVHVVDLTEGVARVVAASGIEQGTATVFIGGSTAAVTTMEFEPGAVEDLREAVERLLPRARPGADGRDYAHNARNGDDNAHAHLRAAMLGPSASVPVLAGRLALGTWQQIVLVDFDDRPREREVVVQVVS